MESPSLAKRCSITKGRTQGIGGDSFSAGFATVPREVTLKGCHDEVGHLGLEHMLDLMCDQFFGLTWLPK